MKLNWFLKMPPNQSLHLLEVRDGRRIVDGEDHGFEKTCVVLVEKKICP